MTATRPIIIAQFFQNSETNTVTCATAEEARRVIAEGNTAATKGWRWGLSQTNFTDDEGVPLTADEANEIRRACGVQEY